MHFLKTVFVAVLGLSAMTFAAPIEADVADGCNGAFRGEHRSCERGRELKHDGRRDEQRGLREIQYGDIYNGVRDEMRGEREIRKGQNRECRTGGRC